MQFLVSYYSRFCLVIAPFAVGVSTLLAVDRVEVDFAFVEEKAKALAAEPYKLPPSVVPEFYRTMNYDQYRAVSFRGDRSLWRDWRSNFRAQFFHPGYLYNDPVQVNEFTGSHAQRIRFNRDFFDYSKLVLPRGGGKQALGEDLGYGGFKLLYPLDPEKGWYDEVAAFLGASYFRMLGRGQGYGISARGIAIDTAIVEGEEEFPRFVEYWLRKPKSEDDSALVFALLDGPSVSGAYSFLITPGEITVADVKAAIYLRKPPEGGRLPKSLGLAPLTSMYWFGENTEHKPEDYRPEVHDSDGLLIHHRSGEKVWRPLVNKTPHQRNAYINCPSPRGFGLLQRDREFSSYQDLSNGYHKVPSLYIEPRGDWGEGWVRLLEIPTRNEVVDNVVAFWEPFTKPEPGSGKPLQIAYRMHWTRDEAKLSPDRVFATRMGANGDFPDTKRFAIDFKGPTLKSLKNTAKIVAEITSSANGFVTENQCFRNDEIDGWRVMFKLDTDDGMYEPVELRCTLRDGEGKALAETWIYQWNPPLPSDE